ncbi:MAG: hypothetical protein JXA66_07645 [Oligoflexia bacterium]|nr:hypothetical protein [Oligoflexia bacterium]
MNENKKSDTIQIRVSANDKKKLKRLADTNRLTISEYIIKMCLLDNTSDTLRQIYSELACAGNDKSYYFAFLNDYLMKVPVYLWKSITDYKPDFPEQGDLAYVAALMEQTAHVRNLSTPSWCSDVKALDEPFMASSIKKLRLYLLINSPVPFRKRNIFIDSSAGDRV